MRPVYYIVYEVTPGKWPFKKLRKERRKMKLTLTDIDAITTPEQIAGLEQGSLKAQHPGCKSVEVISLFHLGNEGNG